MTSEAQASIINFYEYLNLPQDAPLPDIQQAFEQLEASTQEKLNNPLTMKGAQDIANTIIPGIRQSLLSGDEERRKYDQRLAVQRAAQARREEMADEERLDDILRRPFFFDPLKGYDTETPGLTLRLIASKLDDEWLQACTWLTDTSSQVHAFTSFLKYTAGRAQLAERINGIIQSANRATCFSPEVHRAIERCIMILDPRIIRPTIRILNPTFDGKVLHAGDFISDMAAQVDLILGHDGFRGCAFGRVESSTHWVTFAGDSSTLPFTLLPEGTDSTVGQSEVRLPLTFHLEHLERNTDHAAEVSIFLENFDPPHTLHVPLTLHILPTPPRVTFNPPEVQVATVRRGTLVHATATPLNCSLDEELVPLAGTIRARDPDSDVTPQLFHHATPVTFSIDTSERPRGEIYQVFFDINCGTVKGTQGPDTLRVWGELLPSPWQSILRTRELSVRALTCLLGGLSGLCLFLLVGLVLAGPWPFLLFPLLFLSAAYLVWETFLEHRKRAGEEINYLKNPNNLYKILAISIALGLALALICALNGNIAPILLCLAGGISGSVTTFLLDSISIGKLISNNM